MAFTRASAAASKVAKNSNNGKTPESTAPEIAKAGEQEEESPPSSSSGKRTRSMSAGIRVIAGRIYDSENGKTCHQCRQKTLSFAVSCKNRNGGKQCTFRYCHICLLNRYGEKAETVAALGCKWKCPCCRGVCNCCICMKKRGCAPTGKLVPAAKAQGFSSVSEMLKLEKVEKPNRNGSAAGKKRKAATEASTTSSKRLRHKSGLDEKEKSGVSKKNDTSSKVPRTKAAGGKGNVVKGKEKKGAIATRRKVPVKQEAANRWLKGVRSDMKPRERTKKSSNAKCSDATKKTKGKKKNKKVKLPMSQATRMTKVANLDLPAEDIGHALQFLEFSEAFGQVLDLKKGQAESLLQELTCGQDTSRYDFSLERLHIKLLSMVGKDSDSGYSSLKARGRNSWLEALDNYISGCSNASESLKLACSHLNREGYSKLDGSKKLRILIFLCDEALGTIELRMWIDKKNVEFVQERKKAKKMLLDEEKKNRVKLKNEVAKAVLMRNGTPLSIAEHEYLVTEIKKEASQHLQHSDTGLAHDSSVIRSNPVLSDPSGCKFWKLRSCSGEVHVLLQDVPNQDEVTSEEKWFVYDLQHKSDIERYISSVKESSQASL